MGLGGSGIKVVGKISGNVIEDHGSVGIASLR
jgi:hypothetical protein